VYYDLHQPSREALEWLKNRNHLYFNGAEEALDWIFDNEEDRDRAYDLVQQTLVKRHHRAEHGVRRVLRTRYTAPPRVKTKIVIYDDRHCRVTGELYCLHIDFRMQGKNSLRQNGIEHVNEIIVLDRRAFWNGRLLLFTFTPRILGQRYSNWRRGTRRRTWIDSSGCDMHLLEGLRLMERFSTNDSMEHCAVAAQEISLF
jgi:hypothetical protein